jgi:hypothetical protein
MEIERRHSSEEIGEMYYVRISVEDENGVNRNVAGRVIEFKFDYLTDALFAQYDVIRALEARAKNIHPEVTSRAEVQEMLESDPGSSSAEVEIPHSHRAGNAK